VTTIEVTIPSTVSAVEAIRLRLGQQVEDAHTAYVASPTPEVKRTLAFVMGEYENLLTYYVGAE
jgi:hypothetical protein